MPSVPQLLPTRIYTKKSTKDTAPTFLSSFRSFFTSSWINVLLIFVPLGIVAEFVHFPKLAIFILNFLAIIPLAKLLGFATEELAFRVGETLGALLNATFGNAVELILSVIALTKGLIRVVQASILGSILSNLLLVLFAIVNICLRFWACVFFSED